MKEETKLMIRNSLVSLIQEKIGRAIDARWSESRYGNDYDRYLVVGLKEEDDHLWVITEGRDTDENPWNDSVHYLGSLNVSELEPVDYDCEYDGFQDQIEAYIDEKLNQE